MTRPAVIVDTNLVVTGEKLLLQDAGMHGRVMTPQAFVAGG